MTSPIRVLLVDDHQTILWGLVKLIEGEHGMAIAGVARDASEASTRRSANDRMS
jgi:two-component system, NarL family, nitrate/nitrite response regulator NarL